jgi:hypothetical protein
MLLWEKLSARTERAPTGQTGTAPGQIERLPYETRCAAMTKSGRRCRGKILGESDYCPFHDPAVVERRLAKRSSPADRARRRLSHLPDGYLRKLTSRKAVGQAMDRLYREITLGIITLEMGTVLFGILTRLLDSGLCDSGPVSPRGLTRTKAHRLRPRLADLLTRKEKTAWKTAIANAPEKIFRPAPRPAVPQPVPAVARSPEPRDVGNSALALSATT